MTFSEFCMESSQITDVIDMTLERSATFIEGFYDEYVQNLSDAYNYVQEKGGTDKDAEYLKGQATEGYLSKIKKTVEKAFEAASEAIKKLIDSIEKFFTGEKVSKTLDDAKKLSNKDPKVKKMKVEIPDFKALEKDHDKKIANSKENLAKAKAGKKPEDSEEGNVKTKVVVVSVAAAIAAITAAVVILKKTSGELPKVDIPEDMDPDLANSLAKANIKAINAVTSKASDISAAIKLGFQKIASAIKGESLEVIKDAKVVEKLAKESTSVSELDNEAYFEQLMKECDEESVNEMLSDITESVETENEESDDSLSTFEESFIELLNEI